MGPEQARVQLRCIAGAESMQILKIALWNPGLKHL
jgi:hypothetical protein